MLPKSRGGRHAFLGPARPRGTRRARAPPGGRCGERREGPETAGTEGRRGPGGTAGPGNGGARGRREPGGRWGPGGQRGPGMEGAGNGGAGETAGLRMAGPPGPAMGSAPAPALPQSRCQGLLPQRHLRYVLSHLRRRQVFTSQVWAEPVGSGRAACLGTFKGLVSQWG